MKSSDMNFTALKPSIYKSINHEIHYAMSFIGGGMEIISFKYLYKALIGYMTSNMIFGINSLAEGDFNFSSFYHILIILIWMLLGAGHQIIANKYNFHAKSAMHGYAIAMTTSTFILLLFILIGQYMFRHDLLADSPTLSVMPLVTIGLLFMYIQNFIIRNGGTAYPTTTSVVTTVYVLMITRLAGSFNRNKTALERRASLSEGTHYVMVLIHFFAGAYITIKLSEYYQFDSLYLVFFVLLFLTFRVWREHSILKNQFGKNVAS